MMGQREMGKVGSEGGDGARKLSITRTARSKPFVGTVFMKVF